MDIAKLIGDSKDFPNIDFNSVVKCDNIKWWKIEPPLFDRSKVELTVAFEKDGINSTLKKKFDTIMEAVQYFYKFLKTL